MERSDAPMTVSPSARWVLLAPAAIARTAAFGIASREQRWMLCQPREVRVSYVEEVVDRADDPNAEERWMLAQTDAIRLSYVRNVLAHEPDAPPELAWMLKQSRKVRQSYVREVLGERQGV
jgi:hypothetical protein